MSYETFAYYYDSLMDPQFYEDYYDFIKRHCQFDNVLELGCGTGEIAIRLAKDNKSVMATDLSMDMLEVTKQKIMIENVNILLQRVDMSDFSTSVQVDLILCLCDSLNYLIDKKLIKQTFSNVFSSLKENGNFIFDVHSLYKTDTILNNYSENEVDEEFAFDWNVELIESGYIHHHVYIEDKIEHEKVEEDHYQKTYSINEYIDLLREVGFINIEYFGDFKEYHDNCERVIFVCRKDSL
ncbi:MAG: class I SAM-dependent methyltransferase [Coprobacillus sp.]